MQAKATPAKSPAVNKRKPAPARTASAGRAPTATKPKQKVSEDTAGPGTTKPRVKLVRDSFTMPRDEYELIAQLKARALDFKRPAKKSELLRAGLQALAVLPDPQLHAALDSLRPLKAGRPKHKH